MGKACQNLKLYNNAIKCYEEYLKISQEKLFKDIVKCSVGDCYAKIGKYTLALIKY